MEKKKKEAGRENRERRVKRRRESKFHRGGEKEQRAPGMERYVHSIRNGKVRRDRDYTVEQLVKVLNRIEKRREEDKKIRVVGTNQELGRRREGCRGGERKGKRKNRERVTRGWVSGLLTNYQKYMKNPRLRSEEGLVGKQDRRKEKNWKRMKEIPGLIVFRHPNDHGVGRKEARRSGVPTVGIADSDCKYVDRRTYPVPGNDESREGQRRRRRRRRNLCREEK